MTTALRTARPRSGTALVLGTAAAAVVFTAVLSGIGALVGGSSAGWGALLGAGVTTLVFAFGTLAVHVVSLLMPSASLLVALQTYLLQIVVLIVTWVALERASLFARQVDERWLAGGVIGATLAWMVSQVVLFARARIPVFEVGAR